MKRRPKRQMNDNEQHAVEEFVSGAEDPPDSSNAGARKRDLQRRVYPWEEPQVRQDVKQTYPLRLPEPLHLKLKFISEETGKSMNELCNEAVEVLVESKLEELTGGEREV